MLIGSKLFFFFISCSSEAIETAKEKVYPNDSVLKITDGQVLGTHNSYHIAPEADTVALWNYSHLPLDEQLDLGLRQFEIDIVYDPDNEVLLVQHIPYVDNLSTCETFFDCMDIMAQWSIENPHHFPLQILIEPKDEVASWSVEEHFDTVDETILSTWGDRVWTPNLQKENYSSIRESVLDKGWPSLDILRGRVIFALLDGGEPRDRYTQGLTQISDRVMFPLVDTDHDFAAFFLRDNPFQVEIAELVQAGFLVRTRGDVDLIFDEARFVQALESGAHAVSVDTQDSLNYLNASKPVQCNPLVQVDCSSEDLE